MAKSYIHEIGDKLSHGSTAANLPAHIKEIAPVMYNDGSGNFNSIQSKLNEKAPLASPTFTGTPSAPTAAVGTNTTQIATTAFVKEAVDNAQDIKVKATEKTDNKQYKLLAALNPDHVSGTATEAVYDSDVTLIPQYNTLTANISGNAATTDIANVSKKFDSTFVGEESINETFQSKIDAHDLDYIGLNSTYIAESQRLVLNDVLFDSIYPVIGNYGLAIFRDSPGNNLDPDATEFSGDKDWLLDWRPYLIDMSAKKDEVAKTPVAELKKNNWLRKIDGSYATVCCVKSAQLTALNGKQASLVFGNENFHSTATVAETVTGAYNGDSFVPSVFWEYVRDHYADVNAAASTSYRCGIEVEVYDGTRTYKFSGYKADGTDHIPAPWETTETKYSVFIGREKDCYLVDGYSETTGEYIRGLTAKPVEVGTKKFDPEFFRLRRTGISPGPCTTYSNKVRHFFYNFAGDTNTRGNNGLATNDIFWNNGTYPRSRITQYDCVSLCRSCNYAGSNGSAVPVGESGYHALNAFLCAIEAAYETRNLWSPMYFSSGVSSRNSATDVTGGCIIDGNYYKWSASPNIPVQNGGNLGQQINYHYPKFQCMEPQIAASLLAEMGMATNEVMHWNGGTWRYTIPSNTPGIHNVQSLNNGHMTCTLYKMTDTVTINSHSVACNLLCPLIEGVYACGDVWWYMGGGCDLVYHFYGSGSNNFTYSFYLEPDQTKWLTGTVVNSYTRENEYHANNELFASELAYKAVVVESTVGDIVNGLYNARIGYSPMRLVRGTTDLSYGEGCTNMMLKNESGTYTSDVRTRRRILQRSRDDSVTMAARTLYASNLPSSTTGETCIAAQVLLV